MRSQEPTLPDEPSLARQLALGRNLYTLAYTYADPLFPRQSPSGAAQILGNEIANPPARASKEEIAFLKQREKQIDSQLYLLPIASRQTDSTYLCDGFLTPVRIARKDSGLCVVFTGLVSNAAYDSYSHTARMRAETVMQALLLPCMKSLGMFAADTAFDYIGIAAYYPTTANDSTADVPEMLMIVSPRAVCVKFSQEEITEDELLDRSDVFMADIDTPSDVRKIKIELQ
jgi:hypothetical protein